MVAPLEQSPVSNTIPPAMAMTPPAAGPHTLVKKLAQVMGHISRVAKNGRNEFHKYDYATEADIAAAVREHMAERSLMLVPDVTETKWREVPGKNGSQQICTLHVRFTLHDGDSGETMVFNALGEGQDSGDKATYKAMTGAVKYALLKLFLIPTGDDPEADNEEPAGKKGQRGAPKKNEPPPTGPAAEKESMDKLLKRLTQCSTLEDLEKVASWAADHLSLYGALWQSVALPAIAAQREKLKPLPPAEERERLQKMKQDLEAQKPAPDAPPQTAFDVLMKDLDEAEAKKDLPKLATVGNAARRERKAGNLTDDQVQQLSNRGAVIKTKLEAKK